MGTEVAAQESGNVPALRTDTSRILTPEDISFPRLYVGQAISNAVQDGLVEAGDLFTASDSDDPDPTILAKKGDEDGVLFHVLDLRKGKSRSIEGVLETWRYDDPNVPADAWTTYTYFIAIPEADEDLPYRYLLTRTGKPAAQKINTVLARLQGESPAYSVAFRVTTAERQNDRGRYFVPRIRPIEEPPADSLKVAESLYEKVAQNQNKVEQAAGDNPAI